MQREEARETCDGGPREAYVEAAHAPGDECDAKVRARTTFCLHLDDLGFAEALDRNELLLRRVGEGLHGVDAALRQLLQVSGIDSLVLRAVEATAGSTKEKGSGEEEVLRSLGR